VILQDWGSAISVTGAKVAKKRIADQAARGDGSRESHLARLKDPAASTNSFVGTAAEQEPRP